jgi:hypothetical protein
MAGLKHESGSLPPISLISLFGTEHTRDMGGFERRLFKKFESLFLIWHPEGLLR